MGKKFILVVDDNESFTSLISSYFKDNENLEVKYIARDGDEAYDIVMKNNDIDIILLDLVMPKKDGICFLEV